MNENEVLTSDIIPFVPEYSFIQVREIWYKSLIDGATLWQYCQDTKKSLPGDFVKVVDMMFANITDESSLKTIMDNSAVMCGLADEYLASSKGSVEPVSSVTENSQNTSGLV